MSPPRTEQEKKLYDIVDDWLDDLENQHCIHCGNKVNLSFVPRIDIYNLVQLMMAEMEGE